MAVIDKALGLIGVYRSIDRVFDLAIEHRESRQIFVAPEMLPLAIATTKEVLYAAGIQQVKVKCTMFSKTYAMGDTIYVDYEAETWTDVQRAFAIGHELGHIVHQHTKQMREVLKEAVPGWTCRYGVNKAGRVTEKRRSVLSHMHEYQADQYATQLMRKMRYPLDEIVEAFDRFGTGGATPTHPSSANRIQAIKETYSNEVPSQSYVDPFV